MNTSFDAIVVGAGYIGCAVTYYLARAGLRPVLIDQGGIGAGASRANYGNIQVQDAELTHSLPMVLAGKAMYETVPDELGMDLELRRLGSLLIAEKESHCPGLHARSEQLRAAGLRVAWLDRHALQEAEPHLDVAQTYGALYSPDEMQLNPFKLMNAFALRARESGAELKLHTRVLDFILEHDQLKGVYTDRGPIYAPVTVLATGAWTRVLGARLGLEIPVLHVQGQAAATSPGSDLLRNYLSTAAFFEDAHGDEAEGMEAVLAIAPTAHGNLLIGEAAEVVSHFRSDTDPLAIAAMSKLALRFLPGLRCAAILRSWAAPAAFTMDGRPFLGPVPTIDGLILAAAFKSTVVITPLIGLEISRLIIDGRSDLDLTPFLLSRCQ